MRKGSLVIILLLLLIGGVMYTILFPNQGASSVNSAGVKVPVAANASNIRTARMSLAWDSVKYGTIYYYYVDGRPESAGPGTSNAVAMPGVTEEQAILDVQASLKRGTYRIIALRTLSGEELTSCPYVVDDMLRDNAFG